MRNVFFCCAALLAGIHLIAGFAPSTTTIVQSGRHDNHFALQQSTSVMDLSPTPSAATDMDSSTLLAKKELMQVAQRLKTDYGIFLVDSTAKQELNNAVEALEAQSVPPSVWTDELWGDWDLVCTTSSNANGLDTSRLPFFDAGPLKQIRDAVRKTTNAYLTVTQRIRAAERNDDDTTIATTATDTTAGSSSSSRSALSLNRIDHVLEYRPPSVLRDVLDNLPEALTAVNINPLQVSRSKLVLVHKANVVTTDGSSSKEQPLTIQLSLTAIVLNVAGTSTFLDPTGQDVSSLNLPLGEFLNAGSFRTTYVDRDIRISRGGGGGASSSVLQGEQLRVFVRQSEQSKNDWYMPTNRVDATSQLDVDETMDPEFGDIQSPSDVEN